MSETLDNILFHANVKLTRVPYERPAVAIRDVIAIAQRLIRRAYEAGLEEGRKSAMTEEMPDNPTPRRPPRGW